MAGWSRFVLGHKRLVLLFWLVCLVPAVLGTGQVGSRLSADTALPGEPGYRANQEILHRYGTGGAKEPLVPVVVLPPGTTVDSAGTTLGQAFAALAGHTGLRVVSYATTGDRRFVSADGRTTWGLVYLADQRLVGAADLGPQVTAELAGALPPAWRVRVTGIDELTARCHAGPGGAATRSGVAFRTGQLVAAGERQPCAVG